MIESKLQELEKAKILIRESKYEEALSVINDFGNKPGITEERKLSALLLEGITYAYIGRFQESVEVGVIAYNLSQKLGDQYSSIKALLLQSNKLFFGNTEDALNITTEVENSIESLEKKTSSKYPQEWASNLLTKAWIYFITGEYNKALEAALLSLKFRKKFEKKFSIATTYNLIGFIYGSKGEYGLALDYAMKSQELWKKIGNNAGIAANLCAIGYIHFSQGNIDKAKQIFNQALGIQEISIYDKLAVLYCLGYTYRLKGEIDQALEYYEQALTLSEERNYKLLNVNMNWVNIGIIYRMKGDYVNAIKFLKRGLVEGTNVYYLSLSLFWLVLINLDQNLREEAQQYLVRLKEQSDKIESKKHLQTYQVAQALVLKASKRTRNRYEAESLLIEIAEGEILEPDIYILSLISLCEFFLEELENSNEPEILDELNPYISKLLEIAKEQNFYPTLAETKLLQGRLALIRLNLDDARQSLTAAQKIADDHGLKLLAQKISEEHDNLLEELETWQSLKKTKASLSKRMELATVDSVMERMLGKRAIEPPELVDEEPIVLLIMDKNGI
jgi:tetratricopeptide (TPR) repeat protein